jgi:transposase
MEHYAGIDVSALWTPRARLGALFGLTPKKYQSGEKDVTGGITRAGDEMVRTALYEAANSKFFLLNFDAHSFACL